MDLGSSEDEINISRELLEPLNKLYVQAIRLPSIYVHIKIFIRKINDLIIRKYNSDLTEFVNSINWTNGCIPLYWALYCSETGYDTEEWEICS